MVRVSDWDDFCIRAWNLTTSDPIKTRWVMKLALARGILKVKVTNNTTCFSYSAKDLEAEFNRIKQFGLTMTRILTRSEEDNRAKRKHKKRA